MIDSSRIYQLIEQGVNREKYRELSWTGSFTDYLNIVTENPRVARNAFQRLYDMIMSYGTVEYRLHKDKVVHFNFFDDPVGGGEDAVYGLDRPLMRLVGHLKSAAHAYGTERRVLLLHGPVGSAKSTIVRLLKKGVEAYSKIPEGALFSFRWNLPDGLPQRSVRAEPEVERGEHPCPMHEEPLRLIPETVRETVLGEINSHRDGGYPIGMHGSLCPFCRYYYSDLLKKYQGDWSRVLDHIQVYRLVLMEKDRIGIGTFQPKDEKNQDSTELTDPRAFNFDGEFHVANRGLIEFIEVLKLDVAFLYDLLGASQEHSIKPKKFAQTDIDLVILGHTNEPEYRKLQNNELMEAFRDRTVKVDIPYITTLRNEIQIYQKDYNAQKVRGKHLAPHTIEIASMWAILTRLEEPKKAQLSLMQKLKLYDGTLSWS